MSFIEQNFSSEIHPIDLCEHLAEHNDWEFDRVTEDQIAMAVEGQWRTYSLTLAWSDFDETLRLICTFEMEPPEDKLPHIYEVLNRANDQIWTGAFTYWPEQHLMVYRYGLVLSGAVGASERFSPAFQLAAWSDRTPAEAMEVAICEAYGRA